MKKIQMVDLRGQYNKIQQEIDEAVLNVVRSTAYINGPDVKAFQKELEQYLGVKHVVPCANGTDALQVTLMGLGLQPGDEVISVSFTFVATVEVVRLLGMEAVLVDCEPDTFNMDIEALKRAITPKSKAIIPVHLFGQCANMEAILEVAEQHDLKVIEDTAQAIGANYTFSDGSSKKAGTIGHVGTTSFFPSKNLGCYGDGGAIFTNDDELAARLRMMVNHGMERRYYHDEIGVNSRLDSIQAAILRVKLQHLDEYNLARRAAAEYYNAAFAANPHISTPAIANFSDHVFHQYTLKVPAEIRDGLQEFLASKDIPAMIYYPVPLHRQVAYKSAHFGEGDFPVTEELSRCVISLPMSTELDEEQLAYITSSVNAYIEQKEEIQK